MPLIAPILDDRSFEDLFAELRNRIPVYNPTWTDHLDSDPGITLLQLFAYLGEGLQFRFNQIPEATQIAFLKLLDLPMEPARAAQALLRFESKVGNGVVLYGGDQVKAGKTLFTLTQDATIWPLDCVAVARRSLLSEDELSDSAKVSSFINGLDSELSVAVKGSVDALRLAQGEDLTVAPYEVLTLSSDGMSPPIDFSATVDGNLWIAILKNESVVDDPLTDLKRVEGRTLPLSLGFAPAVWYPGIDEVAVCGADDGPSLIWQASLATLKKDGSPDYTPVRVAGDTSAGFTRQGIVRLELPVDLAPLGVPVAPAGLAGSGDFPPELDDDRADQLWFWLRVWRGDGSRIGEVRLLTLNAVAGEQTVAAAGELLGGGNGQPGQQYQLANAPVLRDARYPVRLQVEESGVWTDWTQVETLDASLPGDRHFALDGEAATVRFGQRYPQLGERIRVMGYRWGGGAAGNVPAKAIDKVGDTLAGPLPPYGPDGNGWPLGRRVLARELEGVAMQVEGVEYIEALRLDAATSDDAGNISWAATETLSIKGWEVPEVAGIIVVDDGTALPPPGTGLVPPLTRPAVPVPVLRDVC